MLSEYRICAAIGVFLHFSEKDMKLLPQEAV
jgi:hypothetical protein